MAHLAATGHSKAVGKLARPLLSANSLDGRRRVLNLYRAWIREVPHTIRKHALDITPNQGKSKVREVFKKNSSVKDLRLIDMLYIKGKMELEETHNIWKQGTHVMRYFNEAGENEDNTFLAKFFAGYN